MYSPFVKGARGIFPLAVEATFISDDRWLTQNLESFFVSSVCSIYRADSLEENIKTEVDDRPLFKEGWGD